MDLIFISWTPGKKKEEPEGSPTALPSQTFCKVIFQRNKIHINSRRKNTFKNCSFLNQSSRSPLSLLFAFAGLRSFHSVLSLKQRFFLST